MDIKDLINTQIQVLVELNEVLDFEKGILIKDNAAELPGILEKKKLIAQKVSLLERKRQELYGNKIAEDFIAEGRLHKNTVDRLRKLTEDAREKSEVNLILTRQSIYYIRMITSALNPNPKVVTYGSNGQIDGGITANSFTRKV